MPISTHFIDRLANAVRDKRSPLMVGIDPRWAQLPVALRADESPAGKARAFAQFGRGVIEAVAPCAAAIKPQMAFFEELGPVGMATLAEVIDAAHQQDLLVVLDGKRNDIGSTAAAYARGLLGAESAWRGDALTVSPYLGDDSLTPFVDVAQARGAGVFVLVKTSNPGGALWQDKRVGDKPLYRHVGEHVESLASSALGECGFGAVGAVVGATYPEQLAELRATMPHTWFLVPGFGAQGGSAADVAGAFDAQGLGAVINSSRGVIFAYNRPEYEHLGQAKWQEAVAASAKDAAEQLRGAMANGAF